MRKLRSCLLAALTICILLLASATAMASTWEFGTYGEGANPFTPRGYVLQTENGNFWLSSLFDNSTEDTLYTGNKNGLSYIEAVREDGKPYTLYAYTDRNPRIYKYLFAYKNGEPIANFNDYAQAPGRLEIREIMGSGAIWGIPIEGFVFEPGCYYEFGFYRGLQANNGITLVFANDGKGYIQNPSTDEELAKYEADKYKEFEFVSGYWVEFDEAKQDYVYDFHLVPMRFSVQTYADVGMWREGRQEAADFLAGVSPADYESGRYVESNVENLRAKLAELDAEIETKVRLQLQESAAQNMDLMLGELGIALEKARSPKPEGADLDDLKAALKEARIVYREGSKRVGTGLGEYNAEALEELAAQIAIAEAVTAASPQAEVNAVTEALRSAITRVYATVVREDNLILADEASGIKMIIPAIGVTAETRLFVKRFSAEEAASAAAETLPGTAPERLTLYEIRLLDKDIPIEPTQKYNMQIPVPQELQRAAVYHISAEGQARLLTTAYADGYKLLSDKVTGLFAIVAEAAREEEPPVEEPPAETAPPDEPPPVEPPPEPEPQAGDTEPVPPDPAQDEPIEEEPPEEEPPAEEDPFELVETTDDEIKDTPDNTEQEVKPDEGEIYVPEEIKEEELRGPTGAQYPIIIPTEEIQRTGGELPLLLMLALLLLSGGGILAASLAARSRR